MLRAAYGYTGENVLGEEEKYKILKDIVKKFSLEYDDEENFISDVIGEISKIKGEMIDVKNYYSTSCSEEVFRKIYNEYKQNLNRHNKIDFDDMLVYCYELLKERPDICKKWQDKYTHILVDEFQDINRIQYEILKLLAMPRNNLFIVGDDDQSIYGFRGAKPEIMLNFAKDYENAITVLLDTNFRSSEDIVAGSIKVIEHNQVRYNKDIKSNRALEDNIKVHVCSDGKEEVISILKLIDSYHKEGIDYDDMAVICRLNTELRGLISKLMEYNVPFIARDRISNIYDHFVVRNILDYVKAAMGDNSRALYLRIMNRPNRYLKRDILTEETVTFEGMRHMYEGKEWALDNIDEFESQIKYLKKLKPFAAINFIRKGIGYDGYLKEYADYRHIGYEDLLVVLDELAENTKNFNSYEEWFSYIENYENKLLEQAQKRAKIDRHGVTVTTMHSSKGLEYKVVIIMNANEGITPYKKAVKDADIEEERRMFYVAMTRAKTYLHVYSVRELYGKKGTRSRFLDELLAVDDTQ